MEVTTSPATPAQPAVNMTNESAPTVSDANAAHTEIPVDPSVSDVNAEETPEAKSPTDEIEERLKKGEEDFSRRFAALTRKERDVLAREKAIKDREQQIGSGQELMDKLKSEPLEILKQAGWSFKELADYVLNDNKVPAEKQNQSVIDELRAEIAELRKDRDDDKKTAQQKKEEQAEREFRSSIQETISSDVDKYELINVNEAYDMVYDVIESHYEQTIDPETGRGEILDIHKAAQAVEHHLEQQAERFMQAKKLAAKFKPQGMESPQEIPEASKAKTQPSPTLTHRQNPTASVPTESSYILSDDESKAAAAEFLRQELAKKKAGNA